MMLSRTVRSFSAMLGLAMLATSAWAQDYAASSQSNLFVSPPSSGTVDLIPSIQTKGDGTVAVTSLPFPVAYFGQMYSSMQVCTNGFVQFGGGNALTQFAPTFPLSGANDGICAPVWDDLDHRTTGAQMLVWSDGTAPARRFIVCWSSFGQAGVAGSTLSAQVQFFEGTGRIQMAYGVGWSGQTRGKAVGLDAVSPDNRYVTPDGSTLYLTTPVSQPGNDWRFDPKITTFSGRVLYDRLVVDASGIGNSLEQNRPLAGLQVELRSGAGATVAAGFADTNGDFTLRGPALVPTDTGSIAITSQCAGGAVRATSAGPAYAFTIASSVSFASDRSIGTAAITSSNDATAVVRAPLHIARTIQSVHEWAAARTSASLPTLEILYDTSSAATTSYTPAGASPASMRVSGAATANPDPWDSSVLRKTYARHLLAAIAVHPTTMVNTAFDTATDEQNAFAEGFGYYVNAAVSGEVNFTDGTSGSAASQINLESPTLASTKGPDVAGWVAAALYDLTDASNEVWDTVDGTGSAADKVFQAVDSLTSAATASTFYAAWGAKGFDGLALARNFIRHGLIGDDSDEPNDAAGEARVVSQFGFIRPNRILNLYQEDWYEFTLPAATNAMTVDIVYDRLTVTADVTLRVLTTAGAVIATGSPQGTAGPLRAVTGPVSPGTYRAQVRHDSGARLDSYTVQAFSTLTLTAEAFRPWTVGRPYNVPVQIAGGIPPYSLGVDAQFTPPAGLIFDGPNSRVTGTPSKADTFDFSLSARDVANPNNVASVHQTFVVNPALTFSFGEFLAFASDKVVNRQGAYDGGTAPLTFTTTQGALPNGVTFAPGEFRYVGNPDTPGSGHFTVEGSDAAGSTATGETTGVACVPFGPATLAEGDAACGFWFDAVQGSAVTISVKAAKKQAKRTLRAVLLAPDGATEIPVVVKAGVGKATVSKFVVPSTGRFYCVVASSAGASIQLTGGAKIAASKGGKGTNGPSNFVPGNLFTVEFGALAGASVSFSAKPDKSGLQMKAQYLIDPTGATVSFDQGAVKETKGAISFTKSLPTSGTWKVVLGAKSGPQGKFTYSFKLKQPKGVGFSAD